MERLEALRAKHETDLLEDKCSVDLGYSQEEALIRNCYEEKLKLEKARIEYEWNLQKQKNFRKCNKKLDKFSGQKEKHEEGAMESGKKFERNLNIENDLSEITMQRLRRILVEKKEKLDTMEKELADERSSIQKIKEEGRLKMNKLLREHKERRRQLQNEHFEQILVLNQQRHEEAVVIEDEKNELHNGTEQEIFLNVSFELEKLGHQFTDKMFQHLRTTRDRCKSLEDYALTVRLFEIFHDEWNEAKVGIFENIEMMKKDLFMDSQLDLNSLSRLVLRFSIDFCPIKCMDNGEDTEETTANINALENITSFCFCFHAIKRCLEEYGCEYGTLSAEERAALIGEAEMSFIQATECLQKLIEWIDKIKVGLKEPDGFGENVARELELFKNQAEDLIEESFSRVLMLPCL